MSLSLSKLRREKMKKLGILAFSCLLTFNSLYANEDKLDVLDQQSKEFFKAITGLEKDYLEEQIKNIKSKENGQNPQVGNNRGIVQNLPVEKKISQEEYEKNVFKHENEMARLTTDFTRTKKLKDISIKSMYSFNGKSFVNLKLESSKSKSSKDDKELSLNIEGRYTIGDYILTHQIIDINTRTKIVKLYKKLDEEYGYVIYLSNYGISVSDLQKRPKEEKIEVEKTQSSNNNSSNEKQSIKEKFKKVSNKPKNQIVSQEVLSSCLYTVNVSNLNVRNSDELDATILRILRINDQFTVLEKKDNWLKINTIYKKISGDVMVVEDKNNWVNVTDTNVTVNDNNCL